MKPHQQDRSLQNAPAAVFRVWNYRWRIEHEAADVFAKIARELHTLHGPSDPIARQALDAAKDELRHADFCDMILRESPIALKKMRPGSIELGPANLTSRQKALYACVAMGCVTESLSTALLLEMQDCASEGLIKQTVHAILKDEVNHGRIGWAELARAAQTTDVSWLTPFIPGMIHEALRGEVEPLLRPENETDLSPWGILQPSRAYPIMRATIDGVIIPGLRKYGVGGNQ